MPMINVFVDDRTLHILQRVSQVQGVTVEILASRAIESDAITYLPGGIPHMHFGSNHRLDLGGVTIGLHEQHDGSFSITP